MREISSAEIGSMAKFRPSGENGGKCFFCLVFFALLSPLGLLTYSSCLTRRCRFARCFAGFDPSESCGGLPGISQITTVNYVGAESPESRLSKTAVIPGVGLFTETRQACVLGFLCGDKMKPILGLNLSAGARKQLMRTVSQLTCRFLFVKQKITLVKQQPVDTTQRQ